MLWLASLALRSVYLLLPAASVPLALRGRTRTRRFVTGGWVGGALLGVAVLSAYALGLGGRPSATQLLLTLYLGVGLLLFLKSIDWLLQWALRGLFRTERSGRRAVWAGVIRVVLFTGFALPWLMAAVMVYRPRVVAAESASEVLGTPVDDVTFPAADGSRVAGWFVGASARSHAVALLCHGLGSSRAGFFTLMSRLHDADISVLAIDLRAHGDSAGQVCSFGLRERDDVRGAVDWLRSDRPDASRRIVGVGASLGAAALLGAAAGDGRIDGVVVLSTYPSLAAEVRAVSQRQLVPPIGWLVHALGLPFASLHAGIDLRAERPVDDIASLWPRPVLVVHGTDDEIIPFDDGRQLYDAASIARQYLWVQHGTHNGILNDKAVVDRVLNFIRTARATPVV